MEAKNTQIQDFIASLQKYYLTFNIISGKEYNRHCFGFPQVLGFPSQVLAYLILVFVGQLGINVAVEIELKEIGAEWKVPLEQLCKKGLEAASGAGQFQHRHLSECTSITSHLDTSWRKLDLARWESGLFSQTED